MKTLVIATAHAPTSSTIIGRIKPLADQLSQSISTHILTLGQAPASLPPLQYHSVGTEPFVRTASGKRRLRGAALVRTMLMTALRTTRTLRQLKPDCVIISKPLPANTLGVLIWHYLFRPVRTRVILDTDDFELTANALSSIWQRAVLHWSERAAARVSDHIVAATPFLADHFAFLTNHRPAITLIPTGLPDFLYRDTAPPLSPEPVLLYIGSVSVTSGHRVDILPDILERLCTTHPGLTLTIAGDGDDVASLKQAFKDKGLDGEVTWHGRFSLEEVPELIRAATIVLDPIDDTLAQRAKSSFRVLAAAASGRALVTSNIGIRLQFIPADLHTRVFARPDDAVDYARVCDELLAQPLTAAEQKSLITCARRFSWTTLAAQYQAIMSNLQSA